MTTVVAVAPYYWEKLLFVPAWNRCPTRLRLNRISHSRWMTNLTASPVSRQQLNNMSEKSSLSYTTETPRRWRKQFHRRRYLHGDQCWYFQWQSKSKFGKVFILQRCMDSIPELLPWENETSEDRCSSCFESDESYDDLATCDHCMHSFHPP